ncbi:MAG: teicoplanin resistance protein VanZ [Zymomonas mobilis]
MISLPLQFFIKVIFWLTLLAAYGLAIMPAADTIHLAPSDKIDHIIAFVTLTILACLGWQKTRSFKIAVGLGLFGALIELTQAIPFIHRDAELADWLADISAVLFVLLVRNAIKRFMVQ